METIREFGTSFMHSEEIGDLALRPVEKKQKEMRVESGMSHRDDKRMNPLSAKGLCLNCDDAETCKFSGFGDDILFCEEHSSNFDNARQDNAACRNAGIGTNFGVKRLIPGWDS